MPSEDGVWAAFAALEAAGFRKPWDGNENIAMGAELWTRVLGDCNDGQLEKAVLTFIRGGARFWPKPGELLEMAPEAVPLQLVKQPEPSWFIRCDEGCDEDPPMREGSWYEAPSIGDAVLLFLELDRIWTEEVPTALLITPQGGTEHRLELGGAG